MSLALCIQCGNLKSRALCECDYCGSGPAPDQDLEILFSEQMINLRSLKKFRRLVREIRQQSDNEDVRFWSFVKIVANYQAKLAAARPPTEMQPEVERVMCSVVTPPFEVELIPQDYGPCLRQSILDVPADLYFVYQVHNVLRLPDLARFKTQTPKRSRWKKWYEFLFGTGRASQQIAAANQSIVGLYFGYRMYRLVQMPGLVEIRTRGREIFRGRLWDESGIGKIQVESDRRLVASEIVAIRAVPKRWLRWIWQPRWIENPERKNGPEPVIHPTTKPRPKQQCESTIH
ncbi:MAG: hypothetical protein JSS49_18930 [Planctomycetes bacterium]|nr:hypothetical protein [Planctomycetota bacterium]